MHQRGKFSPPLRREPIGAEPEDPLCAELRENDFELLRTLAQLMRDPELDDEGRFALLQMLLTAGELIPGVYAVLAEPQYFQSFLEGIQRPDDKIILLSALLLSCILNTSGNAALTGTSSYVCAFRWMARVWADGSLAEGGCRGTEPGRD